MVNVSKKASEKLLDIILDESKDPASSYVRVGVKAGGCSGLSYVLDIDDKVNDSDKVIESNGIKLLVDKKSFLYLVGTTLDFSTGLNGKGFHWINPNANRTCGCGESFAV